MSINRIFTEKPQRFRSEQGATLVEYAVVIVLVVTVFVIAAKIVTETGEIRGNKSAGIAKETSIPCIKWPGKTPGASADISDCIESPGCLTDRSDSDLCYCCMP